MSASTVHPYSITEVRRIQDNIRSSWRDREENGFSLHNTVSDTDTVVTFATKFMRGHQRKRHARRNRNKKKAKK